MPNPVSESFSIPTPWNYSTGKGTVMSDIAELRNLSAQWREKDQQEETKRTSAQQAAEYERTQQTERTAFMTRGVELARTGTDRSQIDAVLTHIQKELRFLELGDTTNHFDQVYGHELTLLQEALRSRVVELSQMREKTQTDSFVVFHDSLAKYLSEYRKVRTYNEAGRLELQLQPAVKTEIAESDTVEKQRVETEFEAHFNRQAIKHALENETIRQGVLRGAIEEATANAIKRGLIEESEFSQEAWQPGEAFEAWSKTSGLDAQDKQAVTENLMLQHLERIVQELLFKQKTDRDFSNILSPETIAQILRAERSAVNLRHLRNSTEVIDTVLFSPKEFSVFVWDFLTRPDIQQALVATFDANAFNYWKLLPRATRSQYHNNAQEYVLAQREVLQKAVKAKTDQKYAAFLLTFLGVDADLLTQSLDARLKNQSQPFATHEQAARALLGDGGAEWWHDVQAIEDDEPFLTQLTQRTTLVDDEFVLLRNNTPTEQERRRNFSHALHLKIGLDTPSKFIDYNKSHEIVETKATNSCLEVLNQLMLLRSELPQESGQPQLDSFRNEQRFIKWNLPKFAESYMRLNQELGEMQGRNVSQDAPARVHLLNMFVGGGEPETQSRRLSAFVSLMETELPKWFETHTTPQEKIFTKEQNEQERMS